MNGRLPSSASVAPTTREPLLLGVGMASATLFSPSLLDVVLALNLSLLAAVLGLHAFAAARERSEGVRPPRHRRWAREPFVSVHVLLHGEPLHVVARTLESLRRLQWSEHEVIVVDSDTADDDEWRARERMCARLGPRFRLLHLDRMRGGKAAALDLCARVADPRTELVLVVDGACRLQPRLLQRAARYFDEPGISHVQFPATYARAGARNGLIGERASYFDVFAPFASKRGAVLVGDGPCLVQKQALDAAGGWRGGSSSADAELRVRLLALGFRGRYAPEVAARGMLPSRLLELRRERRRSALGDAQLLFGMGARGLLALGRRRALAASAQLTARCHFLLLPLLVLPALALTPGGAASHPRAALLAALAFPVTVVGKAGFFALAPDVLEERKARARAFLAHLGTLWDGSLAWPSALFGVRLAPSGSEGFARTGEVPRRGSLRDTAGPLAVAAVLAASSGALLGQGHALLALACLLGSLMFGAILYVEEELLAAHATTSASAMDDEMTSGARAHVVPRRGGTARREAA